MQPGAAFVQPLLISIQLLSSDGLCLGILDALMDCGATHYSYIAEEWVEAHRAALAGSIFPLQTSGLLADGESTVTTKEVVRLHTRV
jgi:hypothetical protein